MLAEAVQLAIIAKKMGQIAERDPSYFDPKVEID